MRTTKIMTEADLRQYVIEIIDKSGGMAQFSRNHNLHLSQVSRYVAGQRGPGQRLLDALGIEEAIVYKKGNSWN